MLVSRHTALGTGPFTADYRLLTGWIDLERIRQDRIGHEALTNGADPLRLAPVFGIDYSTAMTYARFAHQILADHEPTALPTPATTRPAGSTPTIFSPAEPTGELVITRSITRWTR